MGRFVCHSPGPARLRPSASEARLGESSRVRILSHDTNLLACRLEDELSKVELFLLLLLSQKEACVRMDGFRCLGKHARRLFHQAVERRRPRTSAHRLPLGYLEKPMRLPTLPRSGSKCRCHHRDDRHRLSVVLCCVDLHQGQSSHLQVPQHGGQQDDPRPPGLRQTNVELRILV